MSSIRTNRLIDTGFKYVGIACTFFGIVVLLIFLGDIIIKGITRIDWDFMSDLPSRRAERAGILTSWLYTTFAADLPIVTGLAC